LTILESKANLNSWNMKVQTVEYSHKLFYTTILYLTSKRLLAECQWLTPVILATQEAEIRRIVVQSQPSQIVLETLS
jgi:hypothetical protein